MTENSASEHAPKAFANAIDLAAEPDFQLGALRIQPSLRRIATAARTNSVEPRVMQALIALAHARGAVVSRDALIDRCWAGRIVGEDAINRCIAKVRALADATEPPAFAIETIPRVGYLLKRLPAAAPQSNAQAASPVPGPFPPAGPPDAQATPPVQIAPFPETASAPATPLGHPAAARRGLWRQAGIAAFVIVVAITGTFFAFKPASPVIRSTQFTAGIDPFNPPPHSLAVLAFANMSGDSTQEYFSDGLSEELIELLSRVPALRVAGRTSSFSFKSKPATIAEIARTLNVGAVLEGSVRRQGNRLRITAALNDARTGYQLWAQYFDRDQADIFALQTDIASAVTEALQVTLLGADAARLGQGGTNDPSAFDAYLQGVRALRQNTIDSYHTAIAGFDAAIKRDPGFALAYSGRADAVAYLAMIGPGFSPDDVHRMFADALVSADRGVALAPDIGATHAARGFVLSNGLLDYARGFAELTRARTAAPGNATIQMIYANVAIAVGHSKDAVAAAQKAVELDPLRQDAWGCLAYIMYQARRYADALDAMQHARAVAPAFPPQFVMGVGMNLFMQGKPGAARDMCETSPSWEGWYCLAFADHALHRDADAASDLAKLRAALGDTGAYNYATIYAQWGQPAVALTWLKRAAELKDPGLAEMATEPLLDPIRDQPDFRAIAPAKSAPRR